MRDLARVCLSPRACALSLFALAGCDELLPAGAQGADGGTEAVASSAGADAGDPPPDADRDGSSPVVDAALPHAADAEAPTGADAAGAPKAIPCAVAEVLQKRCAECHAETPLFGAPMPLVRWSDLHENPVGTQLPVYQRISARVNDEQRPMPPAPRARLSSAERATLEAWFAEGAPPAPAGQQCVPGAPPDSDEPTQSDPAPPDCEHFYELRAHGKPSPDDDSPYTIAADGTTEYACFFFAPPYDLSEQGLWFQPIIDNAKILHHWLLYGTELGTRAPGTIEHCGVDQNAGKTLLTAWGPGTDAMPLPRDVAMELPKNGLFLEFHYANITGVPQSDRSGVRVCTAPTGTRAHSAALHWTGTDGICIEPNSQKQVSGICDPPDDQDIHIVNVVPHMHELGRYMSMTILRKDGTREPLWSGAYDFHSQLFHKADAVLHAGDRIETQCKYENATNRRVKFGERTEDEMCYGLITAWPAGALTYDPDMLGLVGLLTLPSMPAYRCLDETSLLDSCNGLLDAPSAHLTD